MYTIVATICVCERLSQPVTGYWLVSSVVAVQLSRFAAQQRYSTLVG
jgi:hypothetical protein